MDNLPVLIDELDCSSRVGVSRENIRRENISGRIKTAVGLQAEGERVSDGDGRGGASLVQNRQVDPRSERIFRREVLDGDECARTPET